MTKRSRRAHSPAFKAKVALAAVKGERTLAELAPQFFAFARGRLSAPGHDFEDILHVAQSQHHDIGVAKRLGYTVAWIERRKGMKGFGGTLEVAELTVRTSISRRWRNSPTRWRLKRRDRAAPSGARASPLPPRLSPDLLRRLSRRGAVRGR